MTCCDAFSAMTTTRSYRKAMPLEAAIAELRACAGTQFDPDVAAALEELTERVRPARPSQPGSRAAPRGGGFDCSRTGDIESAWTRRSLQVRPSRTSEGTPRMTAVAISTDCRMTP